eukprot:TRINITY_DN69679_c0_g1_i1.p1 TRINITY_DN69679_c0_g1~~TRINITY_DN69679_c0_g1_i1.p1  ORF type:complete len:103 (-),score=31.38 TRINITY_DN69679_c0_g1_i1:53-361(-)
MLSNATTTAVTAARPPTSQMMGFTESERIEVPASLEEVEAGCGPGDLLRSSLALQREVEIQSAGDSSAAAPAGSSWQLFRVALCSAWCCRRCEEERTLDKLV